MRGLTSQYAETFSFAPYWPFYYKYYLYTPENYDPKRKYPLVVLLHGVSRHMRGGEYILAPTIQQKHPSFILVPIAPKMLVWGSPEQAGAFEAVGLAMDAIEKTEERFSIDPNRIYVSGYSMGGTGTFAMLEDYPRTFAAAVALCGTWNPERAHLFPDDVPIFAAHGSEDNPEMSLRMISALKAAGKNAYYREYPGVGHNVWDYVYTDPRIWDWLFAQRLK